MAFKYKIGDVVKLTDGGYIGTPNKGVVIGMCANGEKYEIAFYEDGNNRSEHPSLPYFEKEIICLMSDIQVKSHLELIYYKLEKQKLEAELARINKLLGMYE